MEADPMNAHSQPLSRTLGFPTDGSAGGAALCRAKLPSVDEGWRYRAAFWRGRLANLLGGHRLQPARARRHAAVAEISEDLRLRWQRLFDVPAAGAEAVPFLYGHSVGLQLGTRALGDTGVNLRHLLHVRHRTTHVAGTAACAQVRRQHLVCGLRRALRLAADKALIELQTQVHDADGRLLALVDDSFVARRLPASDLGALAIDPTAVAGLDGLRQRRPQLDPGAAGACTRWLPLDADFGRAYGQVSGDFNPAHTGRPRAWLPGPRLPVVQSLGLRDLVARHLTEMGAALDLLSLTFANPARVGRVLCLVVQAPRLELHDERGHLVAYGEARALD